MRDRELTCFVFPVFAWQKLGHLLQRLSLVCEIGSYTARSRIAFEREEIVFMIVVDRRK